MSLVIAEQLGLGFAGRTILRDVSLRIAEQDRVGLIGRNGSGKSTLLGLISGRIEPDSGTIRRSRSARIGYLPQELRLKGGIGLMASVMNSLPGKGELEQALATVESELARTDERDEQMHLSGKLVELHEELLHFDTHFSTHEAASILSGLGFATADFKRDLSEFSGGWRMRAALASLLFQKPDLLLLDEPTNHLDIVSVAWFSSFLKRYPAAFVLICHDRDFLNGQVTRVVSYEPEGLRQYPGNYDEYLRLRAEEREVLERRAANLAREREAALRFISRFRAQATKARAVQSRIRALEKMEVVPSVGVQRVLSFRFPPSQRSGVTVLTLEGLGQCYGDLRVFRGLNLTVRRGDRVAVIGSNGAGKTTLLKAMAGALRPTEGRVKRGYKVATGYYAQHVTDGLDESSTVLEEVTRQSVLDDVTAVKNVLGNFFFSGDQVDKKIRVLSGGEKARVALAKLMVNPGNLLLMDEPTNHLDLESAEALAEALDGYDGTMVFVSHNLSFINRLATRIWDLRDGQVEEYPGTLEQYLQRFDFRVGVEEAVVEGGGVGRSNGDGAGAEEENPNAKPRRPGLSKNREQSLRGKVEELETRIAELEKSQAERGAELSKPEVFEDQSYYQRLLSEWTAAQSKIDELMARWEAAQNELAGEAPNGGG